MRHKKRVCNPMPSVTVDGNTYKLKSRKTEIPDFLAMTSMEVSLWLLRNTTPKGYFKAPNPLSGMGGIYKV